MEFIAHRSNMQHFPVLSQLNTEVLSKLERFMFSMFKNRVKTGPGDQYEDKKVYLFYGIMSDNKVMEYIDYTDAGPTELSIVAWREIDKFRGKSVIEIVHDFWDKHYALTSDGVVFAWHPPDPLNYFTGSLQEPEMIFVDAVSIKCMMWCILVLDIEGRIWGVTWQSSPESHYWFGSNYNVITQIECGYEHALYLNKRGQVYGCLLESNSLVPFEELVKGKTSKLVTKHICKYISCVANSSAVLTVDNKIYFSTDESQTWTRLANLLPLNKILAFNYNASDFDYNTIFMAVSQNSRISVWGKTMTDENIVNPIEVNATNIVDALATHANIKGIESNIMFSWINQDLLEIKFEI